MRSLVTEKVAKRSANRVIPASIAKESGSDPLFNGNAVETAKPAAQVHVIEPKSQGPKVEAILRRAA